MPAPSPTSLPAPDTPRRRSDLAAPPQTRARVNACTLALACAFTLTLTPAAARAQQQQPQQQPQPQPAPPDHRRVALDATPPDALRLDLDTPAPHRAQVTATTLRAGRGVRVVNARHLRDDAPALQAEPTLDVHTATQHANHVADVLSTPSLSQPHVPTLTTHLLQRAEAHQDPLLGPAMELQNHWNKVRDALAIRPLYGTMTAHLPTSAKQHEGVLISSESVWYNLVNARPKRRLTVDHGQLMPLHFGPYVGNWRAMMQNLRNTPGLQADYGVRLGLSW